MLKDDVTSHDGMLKNKIQFFHNKIPLFNILKRQLNNKI